MFGILNRMIFRELLKVFGLALVGITGILLVAGVVAEASQQGLGPGQILAIIPLLVPSTLPYTIPATTLFATCVVYGRLAADNEVLAVRASGVSLTRIVGPAVALGLLTSLATLGLYYHVIPFTHHLMRSRFLGDVEELLYTMLRTKREIAQPQLEYAIFVKGVQGRRLVHPTFIRKDKQGKTELTIRAHEAELKVDLRNKRVLVRMRHGELNHNESRVQFEDKEFDVPLTDSLVAGGFRRSRDMTWRELFEFEQALKDGIADVEEERDHHAGRLTHLPAREREDALKPFRTQVRALTLQLNSVRTEVQMRPALSLGCLFFVLVGCPVGIWFSRSDFLSSFITCFLPIVFVYYPLVLAGTSLAKDGSLPIVPVVWAADGLMAVVSGVLFWRLLKN